MQLKLLRIERHILQTIKPYTYFSQIYSHLMESVDYTFWAKYICEIHSTLGKPNDVAMEIAAGNCKLAENIKNQFAELYLTDYSLEMLKMNQSDYNTVCCNMYELPFKNSFDFIFATFDSLNYLNTEKIFETFLISIRKSLSRDGLFLFDVSLKHNSIKHLKKLNRKGKFNGIVYSQKSEFDSNENIHKNIIQITTENGEKFTEVHKQKIYDFYYYFEALELAGLYVLECFDAFTFNDGKAGSDRVQFVVKRNA